MSTLLSHVHRLYLLENQTYHTQKLEASGEPVYYPSGGLSDSVLTSSFSGGGAVALNLISSENLVRAFVVDFDKAADWPLVSALVASVQKDLSFPSPAVSVSGRKGFGVWFSLAEPLPASDVKSFLISLKTRYLSGVQEVDLRPYSEVATSAGPAVMKLPPCVHAATGFWSAFIPAQDIELYAVTPWLESAPDLLEQASLLADLESIQPATFYIARAKLQPPKVNSVKSIPIFSALGNTPPPCIKALVLQGVPDTMEYNTANLNLAAYCIGRGLDPLETEYLAHTMAANSEHHHTSKKTISQKLANFSSNKNPPSFSCDYPRHTPGWSSSFNCVKCPANPDKIEAVATVEPHLELTVALELLNYAWHRKEALEHLSESVWPSSTLKLDKPRVIPLCKIAARAVSDGATSAMYFSLVDNWIFQQRLSQFSVEIKKAAEDFLLAFTSGVVDEKTGRAALHRASEFDRKCRLKEHVADVLKQSPDVTSSVLAMNLRTEADALLKLGDVGGPLSRHRELLFKSLARSNSDGFIPTPFKRLNFLLHGGLKSGRLYVLVAPPKAGKTTLTAVCMDHAARNAFPVLYVGYEMGLEQMTEYALARKCRINSYRIETRQLTEVEAETTAAALDDYLANEGAFLELWEASLAVNIGDMAAWATRAKAAHPTKTPLIVVDYLQLARTGMKELDVHPSETQRVSAVAVACKNLARQTGAVVLALSSVTKEAERQSKTEGDLDVNAARDSLAIIHAADGVLTLQTALLVEKKVVREDVTANEIDPWQYLAHDARQKNRVKDAVELERALEKFDVTHPQQNIAPAYAIRARLSLVVHRGSTGVVPLYYRRAFHDMEEVLFPGFEVPERDKTQADLAVKIFEKYIHTNALPMPSLPTISDWVEPLPPASSSKVDYLYIGDFLEAEIALQGLTKERLVGLDFETTGLSPIDAQPRLLSVSDGCGPVLVIDLFKIGGLHKLKPSLSGLKAVAHNAVFDMGFLHHAGIRLNLDCTMLLNHVLTGKNSKLSELASTYLKIELEKTQQKSDWAAENLTENQLEYAALDALVVLQLFPILEAQLKELGSERAYSLMKEAQPVIVSAQLAGMPFDKEKHQAVITNLKHKRDALKRDLDGCMPNINHASGPQLSAWLTSELSPEGVKAWPKTDTGKQLKTSEEVLTNNAHFLSENASRVVLDLLLPFKEVEKKLSTFGANYTALINASTGRIHPSISLSGTVTGRMSCREPNLYNVPRDRDFRGWFTPRVGRSLVIADYGQMELRVAALMANEPALLGAFKSGVDTHKLTASKILGKALTDITKEERQLAKAVNFGLLFGQGAKGLQDYAKNNYGVALTEAEAKTHREAWFNTYPAFRHWHASIKEKSRRTLQASTPAGRVRRWSNLQDFKDSEAYNTPVQGGAAEVMLASLACLAPKLENTSATLLLVVYDEIILECDTLDAPAITSLVERGMEEGMLEIFPDATLVGLVEARACRSWAEKT